MAALTGILPGGYSARASAPAAGRLYPQTGKTLASEFVAFYDRYGGVLQFGYPVSEPRRENGYLVQWTERQRLEHHPELSGTPHEVLLGLLGRELTASLHGPRFQGQIAEPSGAQARSGSSSAQILPHQAPPTHYFPETGHAVAEPFLSYWREQGGLAVYGYPVSTLHRDERGLQVQWFERARFEYHPDKKDHPVLLGHLGLEALRAAGVEQFELAVHPSPAPDTALRIELSQGGESSDPAFFDNVVAPARPLGPGLLRLDNVYTHYDVVQRDASGKITYRWDKLDRVLDSIRAMGREPLICLSYMPETLSRSGRGRIEPPARMEEWAALVEATVRHVNVERRMGVRYWEVWNEPDQDSFWSSSYEDYLRLYDATVEAALRADPRVKLGGPSTAGFSPGHLDDMLRHEASLGARGKVDFISWHEYGRAPAELAAHVRRAREIVARYPAFDPELFVTEFNVRQGGAGDTSAWGSSDRVQGAIALLASIESMQRERLDRAFLFELKDGRGPTDYWGRWGILTHAGRPKPIYHTLQAYQQRPPGMLPITLKRGPADGRLGAMAYGGPGRATFFVWYTGDSPASVKLSLPGSFASGRYLVTLFDDEHNNPARSGDPALRPLGIRDAGDLHFLLSPGALLIITSSQD